MLLSKISDLDPEDEDLIESSKSYSEVPYLTAALVLGS
jgi:hypothetical protein